MFSESCGQRHDSTRVQMESNLNVTNVTRKADNNAEYLPV